MFPVELKQKNISKKTQCFGINYNETMYELCVFSVRCGFRLPHGRVDTAGDASTGATRAK